MYEVSEKGKIVALCNKRITVNAMMTIVKQARQYTTVMPELSVNVSYIIVLIAVDAVIVVVAALV
jgi:hypothetical protein